MTRDQEQFRLPKLCFLFDFKINENWQEAYEECKQDECFINELSDIEEDLKTIIQSIGVIFTDCSAKRLCFLAKSYMVFVHLLDSNDWDSYESVEEKVNYLKECYNAFKNKNDRQLKELSPYFYKLSMLFKEYDTENRGMSINSDDNQLSVDDLMKSLIDSLNEIMLKTETEHDELHCSMNSMSIDERISSYLSHNVNHYDVILAKLFFNQKMICDQIENDNDYKELKHTMAKAIGLINEIYAFPMEIKVFQQSEMNHNFIIKLVEWLKITFAQALQLAPDYVDELLQKFDYLSQKLIETHHIHSTKIKNYILFWKKMYAAAILFCTQTPRYSKFFNHPIKYNIS